MYWKSHGRMEFHADHWATMLPKNLNQVQPPYRCQNIFGTHFKPY